MSNRRRNLVAKQMIPRTSGVNKYILGISPEAVRSSASSQWKQWISASNVSVDLLSRDEKEFKNLSFGESRGVDFTRRKTKTKPRFSRSIRSDLFFDSKSIRSISIYNCFQNETRGARGVIELKLIIRFNKRRPIDTRVCINSWRKKEYWIVVPR